MDNQQTKDGYRKDYKKEHQLMRRNLWTQVWSLTANANDCKEASTATTYADIALEEFDERFREID